MLTLNHNSQLQVSDLCSQVVLHNFTHLCLPSKYVITLSQGESEAEQPIAARNIFAAQTEKHTS
jgi:hypothetical protein